MKKSRALFEEVAAPGARAAAAPGAAERRKTRLRRLAAWWFLALAVLVIAFAVVAGALRTLDPALSATGWAPAVGALPPFSPEDWARVSGAGAQPEGFRVAFWLAWSRQALAAAVGGVWLLGLLGLAAFRALPRGFAGPAVLPGLLIAAQAGFGWWALRGEVPAPLGLLAGAPARLAVHQTLGALLLAALLWSFWRLWRADVALLQARRRRPGRAMVWTGAVVCLAFLAVALGALAAGSVGAEAAWLYADWPLMAGHALPPDAFALDPVWRNAVENPALTTFAHRAAGYLLALVALVAWLVGRRAGLKGVARWTGFAALAVIAQGALGVGAAMLWDAPAAALAHQAGAIAMLWLVLRARFEAAYPAEQSIRG
jgi:cytochrome c oxidase assembly protein subunit 15